MRGCFLFICLVLISNNVLAQWSITDINDSQFANSGVLVRRYASDISIVNNDIIVVSENLVITVLDKDFLSRLRFSGIFNDSIISKSVESKIFDYTGKRIKHAKVELFHDGSNKKNTDLILKLISPLDLTFPITIELEYKNVSNKIQRFLQWKPVIDNNTSVQNASLRLSVSDTTSITFQSNRIPLTNSYINEDGVYIFIWELINFRSMKKGSSDELPVNDLPNLRITSKL